MKTKKSFTQLLGITEQRLQEHYKDSLLARHYAVWLIESITGKKEITLLTEREIAWTETSQKTLEEYLEKLTQQNMPLQYLLGSTPFLDLDILCKPPVLIPRPETEEWCSNLIEQLKPLGNQPLWILDLCTGSGCIALALANAFPKAKVYGSDISDAALALAHKNALHNHLDNVTFLRSDLFLNIPKSFSFDLIVSNPPYIPQKDWPTLEKSVAQWEDKNALIASDNGLSLIKKIIDEAPAYIKPNDMLKEFNIPQLMLEIDYTHGKAVAEYMNHHDYHNVIIHKDLEGKDRVASGSIDNVAITKSSI